MTDPGYLEEAAEALRHAERMVGSALIEEHAGLRVQIGLGFARLAAIERGLPPWPPEGTPGADHR